MATATKNTKSTQANPPRVQRIDPTKRGYETLTEPPVFATSGGRAKSGLRLDIEALSVGEWLNTEMTTDADLGNVRSLVQNIRKGLLADEGTVAKFTVRRAATGSIYVGRIV